MTYEEKLKVYEDKFKLIFKNPEFRYKFLGLVDEMNKYKHDKEKRYEIGKDMEQLIVDYSNNFFMMLSHTSLNSEGKVVYDTYLDMKYGDIRTNQDYIDIKVGMNNLAGAINKSSLDVYRGDFYVCIDGELSVFYIINAIELRRLVNSKTIDYAKAKDPFIGEVKYGDFGHRGIGYFKAIEI